MNIKHRATLPDGRIVKRVSKSRTYSHVIAVLDSYENALVRAKASDHGPQDMKNFAYYAALASGTHEHVQPTRWHTPEQCAVDIAKAAAKIAPYADARAYAVALRAERIAKVEAERTAGRFSKWGALTWAGNERLALTQLSQARRKPYYADARMIPAEVSQ